MQEERMTGIVPVHYQIADDLRSRIGSGELAPEDALPTTAELVERWGCSDLTARKAIEVLREEGRVTSGRGKAPTVKAPVERHQIALSNGWTQVQKDLVLCSEEERQVKGAIELTAGIPIAETHSTATYTEVAADAELAEEFGITVGSLLIQRFYEMVHRTTGRRVSWSVSYMPKALIESNPALLDEQNEPWPGGHQHQLWTVGIELIRFERRIYAAQPTPGERQKWGMDAGTPMLHVLSRSIDTDERCVEFSEARYPADRTEIAISEPLRRWTSEEREGAATHAGKA